MRWVAVVVVVMALILVPFALWGTRLEAWSLATFHRLPTGGWAARLFIIALLTGDIFLPIPSSAVSTLAGLTLGFWDGMLTSTAGMSLGCALGYATGRTLGRPAARRLIGETQLRRLEEGTQRWGDWILVMSRAVPVLAEASTLFAGMSGTAASRYMLITLGANIGISAVYAAVGAFASTTSSFLLVFAGAVFIPVIALMAQRASMRRRVADPAVSDAPGPSPGPGSR